MAKITVQAISRKAKQIRKGGESWISAIRRASKMLKGKSGTVGAPRKKAARRKPAKSVPKKKAYKPRKPVHQTGKSSRKIDKRIRAKAPGKRKSSSGATYYEYRRNRSDMPGQMTGTKRVDGSAYREMILRRMQDCDRARAATEVNISILTKQKKALPRTAGTTKKMLDLRIKELKKFIAVQKKEMSMLKALYK
jgi:hypothetical protein